MILKNYAQKGRIFYHWRIMHMNLSYLVNNLVEKRHSGFLYTNHQKWKEKKKKIHTSTMIIRHIILVYNHCYKHKK